MPDKTLWSVPVVWSVWYEHVPLNRPRYMHIPLNRQKKVDNGICPRKEGRQRCYMPVKLILPRKEGVLLASAENIQQFKDIIIFSNIPTYFQ